MSNQFFVWKNPDCNGVYPDWLELSGKEFYQFTHEEVNKERRFISEYIDPENKELGYFVFEVTKEKYNKWDAQRKKTERSEDVLCANAKREKLSKRENVNDLSLNNIPVVFSIDSPLPDDEELTHHDVIPYNVNDYDGIDRKTLLDFLYNASRTFPVDEQKIVDNLYFSKIKRADVEIAREMNISKWAFYRKKEKIVKKLKKIATMP